MVNLDLNDLNESLARLPMSIETLYPLVTEAIRRAEALEDLGDPQAPAAQLEVSLLEERIAETLPASDPEGALARRGAVRAALAAKDLNRARRLTARFLEERRAAGTEGLDTEQDREPRI